MHVLSASDKQSNKSISVLKTHVYELRRSHYEPWLYDIQIQYFWYVDLEISEMEPKIQFFGEFDQSKCPVFGELLLLFVAGDIATEITQF